MFNYNLPELVKARIDCELGCFVLEELLNETEFDLFDAYSVIFGFIPASYIPSRGAYFGY